ncbi:hypothetical protein FXO38_03029 [Capsicum annuum]|uniref:DUF4283 domain-containing protein n=1 Tax=Capsicum annuum TaxID=4072 RepID=A0A2G3AID9_CAPAN|nr:hypothetical protein FXO38_03029 [Capsicum annuum]PHT94005.1 hypothetical protein T459_01887 [Capsicum annuum]
MIFENEIGGIVEQIIEYEWKPILCKSCNNFGHDMLNRAQAGKVSLNLCKRWLFTTNLSQHKGGRIWVLWKPGIYEVEIQVVTTQMIHSKVRHIGTNKVLWFSLVYDFNDIRIRRDLWSNLKAVLGTICEPWAVMGDFNVLNFNKRVGSPVRYSEIKEFSDCGSKCVLQDPQPTRVFYT